MTSGAGTVLYDIDGDPMAVENGTAIPAATSSLISAGSDGTNAKFIKVDSSGNQIMVGLGTAGSPSGGIITIQGSVSGTPIPITGSVTASNPSVDDNDQAIPAFSTLIGGSDGTNLRPLQVFDLDSGGGQQWVLGVGLRKAAGGGSVEFGTSSDPIRIDPTGATTQPVSSTQLPSSLVGGKLDTNIGSWLGSALPTVGSKTSSNSIPVVVASDQSSISVKTPDGYLDNGNSTSTPLGIGATFTGTGIEVINYASINVSVYFTTASGSNSLTANIQFSNDNIIWSPSIGYGSDKSFVVLAEGTIYSTHVAPAARYMRISITNTTGENLTALNVKTFLSYVARTSTVSLSNPLGNFGSFPSLDSVSTTFPVGVNLTTQYLDSLATEGTLNSFMDRFPTNLTSGRLDTNIGAWLGSTAPTVGQKTSVNSVPVVVASDQSAIPVTGPGSVLFYDNLDFEVTAATELVLLDSEGSQLILDNWKAGSYDFGGTGLVNKIFLGGGAIRFVGTTTIGDVFFVRSAFGIGNKYFGSGGIFLSFALRLESSPVSGVSREFGFSNIRFILTNSSLSAAATINGSSTINASLGSPPTDGKFHRYGILVNRDRISWFIDNMQSPVYSAPLTALVAGVDIEAALMRRQESIYFFMTNPGTPASPSSMQIANISIEDMNRQTLTLADGERPYLRNSVDWFGGLSINRVERNVALRSSLITKPLQYKTTNARVVQGWVSTSGTTQVGIRPANWVANSGFFTAGTVASSSTSDTSAGVGARTIRIHYINSSGTRLTVDVTMNGTSNVNVSFTNAEQIEKMEVLSTGSTLWNVGNISLTVSASIRMQIAATESVSRYACVIVPRQSFVMITGGRFSATATAGLVKFFVEGYGISGMKPVGEMVRVPANTSNYIEFATPIIVENNGDEFMGRPFQTVVAYVVPDANTASKTFVSLDVVEGRQTLFSFNGSSDL